MLRRYSDLFLVWFLTLITALALGLRLLDSPAVRTLAAFPLVLALPGYALAAALFPPGRISFTERLLLVPGLSIAVTALGGLLLNWTPWGLRAGSWAALLGCLILAATLVALFRRWLHPAPKSTPVQSGLSLGQALLFGLSASVIAGAFLIARNSAVHQPQAPFTQLWILPSSLVGPNSFAVGIHSQEAVVTGYRLEIRTDGFPFKQWDNLRLEPGETWEAALLLPAGQPTHPAVEALLYRLDLPEKPYRQVIWKQSTP